MKGYLITGAADQLRQHDGKQLLDVYDYLVKYELWYKMRRLSQQMVHKQANTDNKLKAGK